MKKRISGVIVEDVIHSEEVKRGKRAEELESKSNIMTWQSLDQNILKHSLHNAPLSGFWFRCRYDLLRQNKEICPHSS